MKTYINIAKLFKTKNKMVLRRVHLKKLQPTDFSEDSLPFLLSLSTNQIRELNKEDFPQVWETEDGDYISDGNTRLAVMALRGVKYAEVDYNSIDDRYNQMVDDWETREQGQLMRQQGIKTLYDFWRVA